MDITPQELASCVRTLFKLSNLSTYNHQHYQPVVDTVAAQLRHELGDMLPEEAELRELPYSEVCMHLKVAGTLMWVVPQGAMAQLYTLEGQRYSIPITKGEAGLWQEGLAAH